MTKPQWCLKIRKPHGKSVGSSRLDPQNSKSKNILPRNLTWNLKMMVSKRNHLFQGLLFRFHDKFQWCINKSWWWSGILDRVNLHRYESALGICNGKQRFEKSVIQKRNWNTDVEHTQMIFKQLVTSVITITHTITSNNNNSEIIGITSHVIG